MTREDNSFENEHNKQWTHIEGHVAGEILSIRAGILLLYSKAMMYASPLIIILDFLNDLLFLFSFTFAKKEI